jgi:hypothetical protein
MREKRRRRSLAERSMGASDAIAEGKIAFGEGGCPWRGRIDRGGEKGKDLTRRRREYEEEERRVCGVGS